MLLVADVLQNLPQVDKIQIYHAEIYYQSMLTCESRPYITKYGVIEGVLSVIQRFPKVGNYEDLGFDMWDIIDVIQALQVKFKLYIPYEIVSCNRVHLRPSHGKYISRFGVYFYGFGSALNISHNGPPKRLIDYLWKNFGSTSS